MLNEPRGRIDKLSENFKTEIGNIKVKIKTIKKNQSEINNAITDPLCLGVGVGGWGKHFLAQVMSSYFSFLLEKSPGLQVKN